MDIATKCQTHSAIKSHSKKEYIVRLLFNEKGYEIGRKPWVLKTVGEVVRCKDCRWYDSRYGDVCHNPRYGDGYANYQPPYVDEDYWCKDGEHKGGGEE